MDAKFYELKSKLRPTAGFAILGQKQYPSALVRYWALVRAEVFQSSFVLYLYICFSIGQRFRAEVFQIPQHRKALFVGRHLKLNSV
jgi:hypothetical protein